MPEINGIAHIQLCVTSMARSAPFYRRLLHALGMTTLYDTEAIFYCIGGRTGVAICPADAEHADERFHQRRAGLHHFCLRCRSRADVDAIHAIAVELGAEIVRAPREDHWAPGYYSVLFEDPDGIRIEANHVPGKGHLADHAAGG
jgi:catechol 2,3-dioxygenase-like lactoylglutathione lyase family enzyme